MSIEAYKQNFAKVYLNQKYKIKTINPKTTKTDLDDLQYADDTTLMNENKKEIV